MKKIGLIAMALVAILMVLLCGIAFAGNVYERDTQALGASTGTATWTNTFKNAAIDLKRISIDYSLGATNVITVTRVTSDGVYTQAVGSVTVAANIGTTASFTANYLALGDKLKFSSVVSTGATAIIEFEVQKH